MSREVNKKEFVAVSALAPQKRYAYFVKMVVDWEEAWGLYNDGWALAATNEGAKVFLLWPARVFAESCAGEGWENYEPAEIPLDDLVGELLPGLEADGVTVGVFYGPDGRGTVRQPSDLRNDILKEKEKY